MRATLQADALEDIPSITAFLQPFHEPFASWSCGSCAKSFHSFAVLYGTFIGHYSNETSD